MALKSNEYKHRNLFQAMISAIKGIIYAFKEERNLKIDIFVFLFMLCVMISFHFSLIEVIICCLNWTLIISLEIINTVFERIIDRIWGTEFNEEVKHLKDMSAGAVLVLSVILVLIVGTISISKFGNL